VFETPHAQVLASDQVDHLVLHIVAEDKDSSGGDDILCYSIVNGNEDDDFYISHDKGV